MQQTKFLPFVVSFFAFIGHSTLGLSSETESLSSRLFVTYSPGWIWNQPGSQQSIQVDPTYSKTFTDGSRTQGLFSNELFVGFTQPLPLDLRGELGLSFVRTDSTQASGVVWEYDDPTFDNYTYSYSTTHTRLALKGKAVADPVIGGFAPYFSLAVGVAFNRAHDFGSTPTISQAATVPGFPDRTQIALSYTVGAGLEHAYDKNWRFGLGLEFSDWGKTQLGPVAGQPTDRGPKIDHIYSRGLVANVTYFFGDQK